MGLFELLDDATKKNSAKIWNGMKQLEKDQFVDQVSLTLSILGSDKDGPKFVTKILSNLVKDGSSNLNDFGLYIETIHDDDKFPEELNQKVHRALSVVEDYRIKHALASEPSKDIGI
ncbi:MAG: hypothetical protein AABX38_00100 [Candidatus Micrarchaeota archaeon]